MRVHTSTVTLWLVIVAISLAASSAYQLYPVKGNPFQATGNGTVTFDITDLFEYPVKVGGFTWDPRGQVPCTVVTPDTEVTICQQSDQLYQVGSQHTVWFLLGWDPLSYQINYLDGVSWRNSNITFVEDDSQAETTIEFDSEQPDLQYNFIVRGKNIGQPFGDSKLGGGRPRPVALLREMLGN